MNEAEITEKIVAKRAELIETMDGSSGFILEQWFLATYPTAGADLADQWFRSWLHRKCVDLARPPKSEQMTLPTLGEVPDVVTTYDGEGGFVFKRIRFATSVDLVNDLEIQHQNAIAAQKSYELAKDRNAVLVPVMEEHGFGLAGDAIAFLEAQP